MIKIAIQRTLISSIIFFSDDTNESNIKDIEHFINELDIKYFNKFYARVILRYIEAVKDDLPISYVTDRIINDLKGTSWEKEWMEIMAVNPMPLKTLKLYYNDLVISEI